ncbi:MAG: hypothetical protein JKY96_08285 [Phycisphaerales bacterium]|nr:hypothetical protein [Phycisphaerales bacterium]
MRFTVVATITVCSLLAGASLGDDPLPTLDDLLGITDSSTTSTGENTSDNQNTEELDRALSQQEAGEAFAQAVTLMDQVAKQIGDDSDLGLDTQRIQQSILDKLDKVIESANSNPGSSGSPSSSQQSADQAQPDQQQSQQQSPDPSGTGDQQSTPPGLQEGELADAPAPGAAGWGSLPKRIRDTLTQGLNDTYSELYRTLTEEYYRALAEDNK